VLFTEKERARLLKIFPTGVCDYSKPDQGLPPRWSAARPPHAHWRDVGSTGTVRPEPAGRGRRTS